MKKIKKILKFMNIYSFIQSLFVKTQYIIMKYYYRFKRSDYNINDLLLENGFYENIDKNIEDLNIFYVGGDELQDKSGFLNSLSEVVNDVNYFTKFNSEYGAYSFGIFNRKRNIKYNQKRLIELLRQLDNKPDILLMQMWEWRIGAETLKKIKDIYPNIKIINIGMDDRHSFWLYGFKKFGTAGLIPYIDLALTTSSECVEWYMSEGVPALFYPLASSNEIFYPMGIEKKYDVGFLGAKYGIRKKIIEKLKNRGINVKAYGTGWEEGRLPIDKTNLFYNQCKIVLGVGTILGTSDFIAMKLRDFDVPMSGSVYITNYNPDLRKIYKENEEIIFYKNIDECIDKIEKLLEQPKKMEKIRSKTHRVSLNKNTYKARLKEILKKMGYKK
jgi:hypothetical protein